MTSTSTPQQKVILCGEYGVGKSSIFRRFAFNTFNPSSSKQSTLGLDHLSKEYSTNGRSIKLQLWDTGGMERVASITSSYYKFAEAAILVFSLDNASSFHILSQHLLEVVTYAENAKIFLCGNKSDLEGSSPQVSQADMDEFCEQCRNLISAKYKTSCKTGDGVEEMFKDIAEVLITSNRSRFELRSINEESFKINKQDDHADEPCNC